LNASPGARWWLTADSSVSGLLTGSVWGPATVPMLAVGQSGSLLGKPPNNRGTIPPRQFNERIYSTQFNNPNRFTYSGADRSAPSQWRNYVGPRTYIQFLLDYGRDGKVNGQFTPLSLKSGLCPRNADTVAGHTFSFPPSEQPMHACRRAIIAALAVVEDRNEAVPNFDHRDWVSIISFDLKRNGAVLHHELDGDYLAAMNSVVDLQATTDAGFSTTTDAGLALANSHLKSAGRSRANKVVVLLTDGAPNDWATDTNEVATYVAHNRQNGNFYGHGGWWLDAALMQAHLMEADGYDVWPVGIGLGTVYDFMDRMARMGGTADDQGQSRRGSGDPSQYEQRLVEIFEEIIQSPNVQLVD
jgi:hypothetical protein